MTGRLRGALPRACAAGDAFLNQRRVRYEALRDVAVARHDGSPGQCGEAEAIMELEEGTADFASWTVLYDLGEASREILLRRYRATQRDVFYLTGAMQLHAARLMDPGGMAAIANRIVTSRGVADGSPTAILRQAMASLCRVPAP